MLILLYYVMFMYFYNQNILCFFCLVLFSLHLCFSQFVIFFIYIFERSSTMKTGAEQVSQEKRVVEFEGYITLVGNQQ